MLVCPLQERQLTVASYIRMVQLADAYAESENSIPLDEQILNKLEYEALIEFILQMPEGTKNAMYMKYVAGFTNAEISSALNITENALRQRLFFGRRLIRDYAEAHATNDCT